MKCDIYKATNHKGAYLFVESGFKVEEKVPAKIIKQLGDIKYFKSISFNNNSPLIAANPVEIIENITSNGFHIQGVEFTMKVDEISEAGAAIGGGILAASLGFGPIGAIAGAAIGYFLANASKEEK